MILALSLIIVFLIIILCIIIHKYVMLYNKHVEINRDTTYRSNNGKFTTFIYDENLNLLNVINPNHDIVIKLKGNEKVFAQNLKELVKEAEEINHKAARLITDKIETVKETNVPVYFECPFNKEDGTIVFMICYVESLCNGRIYLHVIEMNAKELVDGRREFIDKALVNGMNSISAGIYTKQYVTDDPRGYRYIFFSQQAKDLFEYKDITKSPYWDQSDEDERDFRVITTGIPNEYERPIKNGDGKIVKWFRVTKKKVASMARYEYILSTVFDITYIKNRELDYQIAKEKAEQSDRFKSAFLANMSHEIRTPLNAIVGFSRLLPSVELEEERAEFTNIINTNNELLLKLIEDILDLSKIEAGYITINKHDFNLVQVLDDLKKVFTLRAKEGVVVQCEYADKNCIVNLDQNRTMQVVSNFLSNSVKFTNRGYITIGYKVVKPVSALDKPGLQIYVEDTGKGIAPENLSKVFERFEKFDPHVLGTGLGMAICKSIVDANNGKIWVESQLGKGTIFYVYFPNCVN